MKKETLHCEDCGAKDKGVFCDLEAATLTEVDGHKISNVYKKGQTLFFQGNPPHGLYCVSTGKIKVSKIGPDGKESIVRIASAGDVIGHRSLFTNELYNATASAIEDSHICFIDKQYILKLVAKDPSVALNLIQNLSHDLGVAENKVASLSQKNVRERLAELLLSLKETFGVKEEKGIRLDIKLTREEMASLIGVANETLIRFLTELKDENIIDQNGKILYILDEKKLLEFANLSY